MDTLNLLCKVIFGNPAGRPGSLIFICQTLPQRSITPGTNVSVAALGLPEPPDCLSTNLPSQSIPSRETIHISLPFHLG